MIFKINFLWIFTNFLLKIIAKITKQGFILISLFPIDTQNLSPDDPFAPPSKKSRTDPPSISCTEASLFSPVQVEPQKKRVIFPSEIGLLETSRFFFRNQSPVSFTTLDEIDTFSKMFPSDMDCEKFFDMDWGRFQSCTFQKELLEKKKKGRLFKILEECFDCKEAFEKKFSKLFLPLYFRLELKNRLRDLSGLNELDHDLAEIIDLGFIPFFISKKTSRDSPFSINEIKIWIEKMLNASIYKEAQSHLQLLLGELEDIYDLCENRVKNILEPPIDHTSPAFITSLKFWVRFLGSYPGCLFQVFELFTEEHPIKEDIEAELKELTEAQAMEMPLAQEAFALFLEAVDMDKFSCVAPFSTIEQLFNLLYTPVQEHPLITKWKNPLELPPPSLASLESIEAGLTWNYLDMVFSSSHPVATSLSNRIFFEYALHKIENFPNKPSKKEFILTLLEALKSFSMMNAKGWAAYTPETFFCSIFSDAEDQDLIKRFWHSFFRKFPDLKEDPHFVSLFRESIASQTKEANKNTHLISAQKI